MSVALGAQAPRLRVTRVARHFARTRGVEVCALQASPLLGAYFAGVDSVGRLALLLVGSLALTAHVFVFNDWADYDSDARDLRRPDARATGYGISRDQVAVLAFALLVGANVALAFVGSSALLYGAGITTVSVLYSFSRRLGKRTPVAASLNHVIGGALHFLLGYAAIGAVDGRGVSLSLFFGLVFAAGHLNQEVRDHEADRANGIATSAVTFGCRRAFLVSFGLFTTAYLLVAALAAAGTLPAVLLLAGVAWLLQAAWTVQALRRGLNFETALWMQRRYRLLFAFVGLVMLVP
jgi:4-hydroxybenzoate polyprenyltransferase